MTTSRDGGSIDALLMLCNHLQYGDVRESFSLIYHVIWQFSWPSLVSPLYPPPLRIEHETSKAISPRRFISTKSLTYIQTNHEILSKQATTVANRNLTSRGVTFQFPTRFNSCYSAYGRYYTSVYFASKPLRRFSTYQVSTFRTPQHTTSQQPLHHVRQMSSSSEDDRPLASKSNGHCT